MAQDLRMRHWTASANKLTGIHSRAYVMQALLPETRRGAMIRRLDEAGRLCHALNPGLGPYEPGRCSSDQEPAPSILAASNSAPTDCSPFSSAVARDARITHIHPGC